MDAAEEEVVGLDDALEGVGGTMAEDTRGVFKGAKSPLLGVWKLSSQ